LCFGHHVAVPWYSAYRCPAGRAQQVERYVADASLPVICYPRNCDTLSFYLGRDDLRNCRSKDIETLREMLRQHPRTVVLCTHRHSLQGLRQALPPELRLVDETHFGLETPGLPDWLGRTIAHLAGETALGLCDVAIVERRDLER